jgi:hypothetical protein
MKSNLQTGIWLIGIGILALTNFWWPGIMFVVGLSVLASGSLQGAIWLFGIGVLGLTDFWWPGMLFLVGISILVGGLRPNRKKSILPDEFWDDPASFVEPIEDPTPLIEVDLPPSPTISRTWLPSRCPACGAPISATEAIWHSNDRAECPYCHSHLQPTNE